MARNSTNDRKAFGVNGPQAHELTESELDNVWGGSITKSVDSASPAFFKNCAAGSTYKSP